PLVWTVLCAGGPLRLPPNATAVSVDDALSAIEKADAKQLSDPAPVYGTPLNTALWNMRYGFDGTPRDGMQQNQIRIVRALTARGAQLSDDERDLKFAWLLKFALHEGPITTSRENPLVWRIVKRELSRDSLELRPEEISLLNVPTSLHGTPLYAAL